jgi:hypothetical protein
MPYIAEFGGKYCLWSTVADAPSTRLMSEWEVYNEIRLEKPNMTEEVFQFAMARVRKYGCSGGMYGPTKADLLAFNRAGPGESHVATEEEMVRLYEREK